MALVYVGDGFVVNTDRISTFDILSNGTVNLCWGPKDCMELSEYQSEVFLRWLDGGALQGLRGEREDAISEALNTLAEAARSADAANR